MKWNTSASNAPSRRNISPKDIQIGFEIDVSSRYVNQNTNQNSNDESPFIRFSSIFSYLCMSCHVNVVKMWRFEMHRNTYRIYVHLIQLTWISNNNMLSIDSQHTFQGWSSAFTFHHNNTNALGYTVQLCI